MSAVFILLLCVCRHEELVPAGVGDASGAVLSLQVDVSVYRSSAGTCASDAETTTTFANGDRLGVIVTHGVESTEHIVFTYNNGSWASSTQVYYICPAVFLYPPNYKLVAARIQTCSCPDTGNQPPGYRLVAVRVWETTCTSTGNDPYGCKTTTATAGHHIA